MDLNDLVKDNAIARTKLTKTLNNISIILSQFQSINVNIDKNMIGIKRCAKILCGICCVTLASLLVVLIIW